MTIKLKTYEVIDLFQRIEEFFDKDVELPKQCVWYLDENYETFKTIVERFEKHRKELIEPLNEKKAFEAIEDGEIKVKEGFEEEFKKVSNEVNDYLNTENEIEIKTMKKKDIPDNLSNKDWKALKFMCVDEDK